MNILAPILGPNAPLAATFVVAFVIVLLLIALAAWVYRLIRGRGLGIGPGGRGRQPRLAVLDFTDVDARRKLVLIRRDNVEHLVMIGGPSDVVIESHITRGAAVPASALRDAPPEPARPSLRDAARQAAGEPVEPVMTRDEPAPVPAPRAPEPVRPVPHMDPPPPTPVISLPPIVEPAPAPPPRAAPPAQAPVAPQVSPTPRAEPAPVQATPPPRIETPPPPAPPAPPVPREDIATRLEAALRKPIASTPARPTAPPPAPAAAPVKPLSPADKSVFDSLEEEMSALLGRGTTPPKT